jgi:PAS domain S-box-containing protein
VAAKNISDIGGHNQSAILKRLLIGAMVIVTVICSVEFFILPANWLRWLFIISIFNGLSAFLLYLDTRGHTRLSSFIFTAFSLTLVLGLAWTAGGIKSPSIFNLTLIPLVAGLLLGWRHTILFSVLCFVGGMFLVLLEYLGDLPPSLVEHRPTSYWVGSVFTISILSLLQYLSVSTLDKALGNAQNELALRQRADEEKQRSEVLRNLIFEGSGVAIIVVDEQTTKIIDCNTAAIKFYRVLSKDEIIGKTPFDFSAPMQDDGLSAFEKAAVNLQKVGSSKNFMFEWKHLFPNGETSDADIYMSKFVDGSRKLIQFTIIDITDRKLAQKKLSETQLRLKSISDNFEGGMFYQVLFLPDGRRNFTYLSESVEILYGVSVAQGMEDSSLLYQHIHPEDIALLIEAENKAVAGFSAFKAEARVIGPDNQVRWSSFVSRPTLLADGSILWDGIEFIITDRKEAEEALRESEGLFRNLIKYTPYHIILSDVEDRIVVANQAFCDDNNVTEDDIIGKKARELGMKFDHQTELNLFDEIKKNGFVLNYEITVGKPDGAQYMYLFSSRLIRYKNNPLFLTTTVDITKLKSTERELENYRNHLEQLVEERTNELDATVKALSKQKEELQLAMDALNKAQTKLVEAEKMAALGVLSAGIAHEINNPLNFIHGGALGIQNYIDELGGNHKAEIAPYMEAIQIGVSRAAEIVSSLSHYCRSDELPLDKCDINLIIDNCLVMLQSDIKNRLAIVKDFSATLPFVYGNEGQLHQVFLNIISNAAQAIDNVGEIKITTSVTDQKVKIEIADNGCGIALEDISRIFDPFFTTKAPGKGTGLGLSIAYRVVHEHQGTLKYDSEIGHGTKAIIELPLFNV